MRPHPMFMLLGTGLPAYTLGASPGSASVSDAYTGSPITTSAVTVSQASGPAGTLSYAWSRVSGSAGVTANSPSSATTTFSGNPSEGTAITAVFRCTATRVGDGATAAIDVPVSITATVAALNCSFGTGGPVDLSAGQSWSQGLSCSTPTNGDGSYTYSWGGAGFDTESPSSGQNTTVGVAGQSAGASRTVTVVCSVHDGSGKSGTPSATFFLSWH